MRPAIERLQGSLIREIANAGMGRAEIGRASCRERV